MSTAQTITEENIEDQKYRPIYFPLRVKPILIDPNQENDTTVFTSRPLLGTLLFQNGGSDARDHAANERTFLSWLRLATYMAIVSVAIVISFHLKRQPSKTEQAIALPFGLLFWFLSLACLASGTANYILTVQRYSRRAALVQSGWKTQVVFTVVATSIVAACILFLSTNARSR